MEGENNEVVAEDDVPAGLYAELSLPDRIDALLAHGRDVLGIAGDVAEAVGILRDVFCTSGIMVATSVGASAQRTLQARRTGARITLAHS